ncbi:hypothetical protein E3E35_08400 [Thermococcus sp. GR7]|uniref:hypothetical protein n=1 Tax=unclassified Thermococcus TaxID=2627626 RepID=UPI0014311CF3|nr:hypothetical protein [Thermococcus sp. GR7]NJE79476.1 hypothetical protein [Thermococcus sp. GR4]NJF23468.1 hypothetical protein [Thermococcus sp. GR5]
MILRKGLALLIGILFIISPTMTVHVAGANIKLVILVSDNEADRAIAENVAKILGAQVVVSPWGTYDPAASAEILTINPDKVIIIGGSVAVPEEYTQDFGEFGIPYERWYGETRYETDLAVIKMLKEEFPEAFSQITSVVIVNGRDVLAIQSMRESLPNEFAGIPILVLTDEGKIQTTLNVLNEFNRITEVRYMATYANSFSRTPLFPINEETIDLWLKKRFGTNYFSSESMLMPFTTRTYQVLVDVQNKTHRAETLLDGLEIPDARKKLDDAKKLMILAWEAYNEGDYVRAYELAIRANFNADFVISRAYREMNTIYQGSAKLQMARELFRLRVMVEVLKKKGYDVSNLEALLVQAGKALDRGDYSALLNDLIPQIKNGIAQLTVKRPIPGIPAGRDRGRP